MIALATLLSCLMPSEEYERILERAQDADRDGFRSTNYGGEDCDDSAPEINPTALEVPADGIDQDCDGGDTCYADVDQDGFRAAATEAIVASEDLDCDDAGEAGSDQAAADCDDFNEAISPGVPEVFYDGIDQNCDGASDYDADMDGYDAEDFGGTDCLDTDPSVHPDAFDTRQDGIDNDCDGMDAPLILADLSGGELLIVEVFRGNSLALADQWFEIVNVSGHPIDLLGLRVNNAASALSAGAGYIQEEGFILGAEDQAVLGINANRETNGGVAVDLGYGSSSLKLSSDDFIRLESDDGLIHEVNWTEGQLRLGLSNERSATLDRRFTTEAGSLYFGNWCSSQTEALEGWRGTPGDANDDCN